jgi:hypothetical protein
MRPDPLGRGLSSPSPDYRRCGPGSVSGWAGTGALSGWVRKDASCRSRGHSRAALGAGTPGRPLGTTTRSALGCMVQWTGVLSMTVSPSMPTGIWGVSASTVTCSAVSVVRPVPCPRRRSSIACRAPPELPEYNSTTWAVKHPGPMICRRAGGSHEDDLQNESGWAACGPPLGIPHITSAARNPGAMRSAAAKPSFDACARRHLAERRNHRGISCWLYKDGAFYDHNTGGVIWRQALSGQRPGDDAFHRNAGMLAVRDPATGYIDGAGRRSRVCGRPLVLRGHARLHATMDTLAHSAGKTVTGVQNPARGSKGRRRAFVAGALRGGATVAADVACLTRRR